MKKPALLIICATIFFLSFIYIFWVHQHNLSDTVSFSIGDQWNYQALAVNLYMGHGYKDAAIEKPAKYKFDDISEDATYAIRHIYDKFLKNKKDNFFAAAPGYPFFLALVYKICGINPLAAKIANIILLAICASWLPIIG
ncbi:MAG: hypothetical protein JW946_03630, partial [Candidatus Omnitrophica bacterium]|nr:hypothetical protein [Candidatus Omnitrophota bacterium]